MVAYALALCACTADVFTGSDAATDGGRGDATSSEAGPDALGVDAVVTDGPAPDVSIQCNNATCVFGQACCTDVLWDTATCGASSSEGQAICLHYLGCDDTSDCLPGQVCCATYVSTTGTTGIVKAVCAASCVGANLVQLCSGGGECGARSCVDWTASPTWLKYCQ